MKLSFIAVLFIHFLLFVLSTDARRIKGIRKRNLQTTMSPGKGKRKAEEESRTDAKGSGEELEERMLMIILNKTIYNTIR